VLNARESMMPSNFSDMKYSDLSSPDLYALNSVPNVEFDLTQHGKYLISDLILELDHFLDQETIEKIELEILSQKMK
jgi:hypothetical protein